MTSKKDSGDFSARDRSVRAIFFVNTVIFSELNYAGSEEECSAVIDK